MQQLIQQKGFHYRVYLLREDDVLVHLRDLRQERAAGKEQTEAEAEETEHVSDKPLAMRPPPS